LKINILGYREGEYENEERMKVTRRIADKEQDEGGR